jgi:hypothetical protein
MNLQAFVGRLDYAKFDRSSTVGLQNGFRDVQESHTVARKPSEM